MDKPGYLLSLEGGGTRSQAALLDFSGRLLQTSQSSDVNTNFVPYEIAQRAVLSAVEGVLEAAGVTGRQVSHFVCALVGPRFGAETFGELCPNAVYHYYRERDVIFAQAGIYRPHGVAVVAATGATAFGVRRDDGREVMFGGWGSLLGDEGSAYALGLAGLRAAARAFEGRESAPTGLVSAICNHFGIAEGNFHREMIYLAYQKPLSRADVAGVAATVSALAAAGDELALRLTRKVADDLANLALHAARRLFSPAERFDMVVAGGITRAGDLLLGELRRRLAAEFPLAFFQIGSEAPALAIGRLALADLSHQEESC